MKSKIGLSVLVCLLILLGNLSTISANNGNKNTNLSGGWILVFIPVMIGIVCLANKGKIK